MQSTHVERWLPIPGYEGSYEVSDRGRVRSLDRIVVRSDGREIRCKGKVLSQGVHPKGYLGVRLCGKTKKVHRLVLEAFVGPCPDGMECCHNNGIPGDNKLTNLRWGTRIENAADVRRHGRNPNINKTHCPKGHPYNAENTYRIPSGGRGCVACRRLVDVNQRRKRGVRPLGTKTHCVNGHLYGQDNVYVDPSGWRHCRTCRKDQMRNWKERHHPDGNHR